MFQLLKAAVGGIVSKVNDGEPMKQSPRRLEIQEEEVLFCKNNVCVHIRNSGCDMRPGIDEHIPGYFSMKKVSRGAVIPELLLTWVPNSLLTFSKADEEINGLEITSCSEVDTSCVSVNETSSIESVSAFNESIARGISVNSQEENDNNSIQKEENDSSSFTECASQKSSTSTSPRHDQGGLFSTPYGGIFSINLSDMKALKLFLIDKDGSSGQLVISNLENQYKVFHFHHSGLEKLSKIFNNWEGCQGDNPDSFLETMQKVYFVSKHFKMGMKTETGEDMHPEDGNYIPLNLDAWLGFLNPMGQIEDVNNFRKHVFFAGLNQEMRQEAWKFLLYCYPVQSTSFERDRMRKEQEDAYRTIHNKRLSLAGEEYEHFWKNIQFTVDKDVVRTDRSHPFFTGQDNPNVEKMRNILLNYSVYNPEMGYTQGMSDLLSPLLSTIQDEVDTFWCFVGLMEFSLFATTPTDKSMDKSLGFLRELLRVMYPEFYIHCLMQDEELDMLFCHRWLVLCFKREFIEPEVLSIWEACWSRYQTDYFHIFVCVAMIRLYGNKCIENKMRMDGMMQYFMDMAMQFDGSAVLREARSILYRFRKFQVIPCTLQGFLSGPGVWDGGIEPEIECVSRHRKCCFNAVNGSFVLTETDQKQKADEEEPGIEKSDRVKQNEPEELSEDAPEKANGDQRSEVSSTEEKKVKEIGSSVKTVSETAEDKSVSVDDKSDIAENIAEDKSENGEDKLLSVVDESDNAKEISNNSEDESDSAKDKLDSAKSILDNVENRSGNADDKFDRGDDKLDDVMDKLDTDEDKLDNADNKSDNPEDIKVNAGDESSEMHGENVAEKMLGSRIADENTNDSQGKTENDH